MNFPIGLCGLVLGFTNAVTFSCRVTESWSAQMVSSN